MLGQVIQVLIRQETRPDPTMVYRLMPSPIPSLYTMTKVQQPGFLFRISLLELWIFGAVSQDQCHPQSLVDPRAHHQLLRRQRLWERRILLPQELCKEPLSNWIKH